MSDKELLKNLGYLAHEIRGSLAGIEAMTYLLHSEEQDQIKKEKLSYLMSSVESLKSLGEQLLQSSLYEQGRFSFAKTSFSLNYLSKEVNEIFVRDFKKKGIALEWELDDLARELVIESDLGKIKQILINLLGNAYKYTKQGYVKVKINVSICKNNVCEMNFEISDTGIGFSEEDIRNAFGEFKRFKTESEAKDISGSGLGLPLVKSMVQSLGGDIGLESKDGTGSRFNFFVLGRIAKEIHPVTYSKRQKQPEFLLVDDDRVSRMALRAMLEGRGVKVHEAENCREAYDLAIFNHIDGVIADQNLPDGEGKLLLKKIKELRKDNIFLALHTADYGLEKESFYETFAKPINGQHIKNIVERFDDTFVK